VWPNWGQIVFLCIVASGSSVVTEKQSESRAHSGSSERNLMMGVNNLTIKKEWSNSEEVGQEE
jgi:hypothetical protein